MPDLLQILCAYCNGKPTLVTWRYLFLRESNNAARCAGRCPNPQCFPVFHGATRAFATPHLGHVAMPHACSGLALRPGNIPMPRRARPSPAQYRTGSPPPSATSDPQRPCRARPAPARIRNIPQYYLGAVPGAQKQKIGSNCNFFAIVDYRTTPKHRLKL